MPAIRDLKGRPVEEMLVSQKMTTTVDTSVDLPERLTVQQAVEKVQAARGAVVGRVVPAQGPPLHVQGRDYVLYDGTDEGLRQLREQQQPVVLPEDFEAGLKTVEDTLTEVDELTAILRETTARARVEMQALRERASVDADWQAKFLKLREALKSIE